MSFIRTYQQPKVFAAVTLGAIVLGALVGWLARQLGADGLTTTLDTIGSIFTGLLQLAVIPLVFTAIVVGITSLRELGGARRGARLGGRTVLWFATTSFIAVLIGIAIALIVNPGGGITAGGNAGALASDASDSVDPANWGSWSAFVQNVIPENFFAAFADGELIQVVLVALLIGAAAYSIGEKARPFVELNQSFFELIQRYLGWIVRLAPVGVFALIGSAVASYGQNLFADLLALILAVYAGSLLVLFGVYPLLLRFVAQVRPATFFGKAWTAIQFAFASRSSGATLPLARQSAVNLGVPPSYAGFAVPLATTTKMDGCAAVFPAISTVFIANQAGLTLGAWQYVGIVAAAVFGALATAGTTGWLTAMTLSASVVGLPPEAISAGIVLIYAVDPIMDMVRTATNVTGQIAIPVLVARQERLLDDEVLHTPSAPPLLADAGTAPKQT